MAAEHWLIQGRAFTPRLLLSRSRRLISWARQSSAHRLLILAFRDVDAAVDGHIVKSLHQPARPANLQPVYLLSLAQPKLHYSYALNLSLAHHPIIAGPPCYLSAER